VTQLLLTPTDQDVLKALRTFLVSVLPTGIEILQAQDNRVPEPSMPDFVTMTPMRAERLATNTNDFFDCKLTGALFNGTMTVNQLFFGTVNVGATVFGVGVADGTTVLSGSGPTYKVSGKQSLASQTLACGVEREVMPAEFTLQLDVHGPGSWVNAQIIQMAFRDYDATRLFYGTNVSPLYADDPRQLPFLNAEQAFENRWIVEAHVEVNQTISNVPQQAADVLIITPKAL
jgi:hypothetical protein